MGRLNNAPLDEILFQELQQRYMQALTYAVRYDDRWEEAERAFTQLQAFREGLRKRGAEAAAVVPQPQRKAA
ncbi:MAG: hypothetical protein HY535_05365 [Chloroflexi bacterium]|nr:hypothetical protein [Chloroflexota bacterium]